MKNSNLEIEKRKLQQLYDRVLKCDLSQKITIIEHIWQFLKSSPAFRPLFETLEKKFNRYESYSYTYYDQNHPVDLVKDINEQVFQIFFIIKIALKDYRPPYTFQDLGKKYFRRGRNATEEDGFDMFITLFLEPFVFYFLNESDRHLLTLEILKSYKKRTEWFEKETLLLKIKMNSRFGEKSAKQHLLRYLFDQNLEVHIEPESPSGKADFVSTLKAGIYSSIIEAKLFGSDANEASFRQAFRQTERYVKDHTDKLAYIVIFITSEQTLSLEGERESGASFLSKDGYLYHFILVDLYVDETSASRSKERPTLKITLSTLE